MVKGQERIVTESDNTHESEKFTRDIIWFTIAQLFVSVIFGIITLPALTKSYSSESYGIWIQISVTVVLMSPLLSLQLGLATVRFLSGEENRNNRRQYIGSMLLAIFIFTCLVSFAAIMFSTQLSVLLFASPDYVSYVGFLILWTFFNALYNFFLSYMRVRGKIKEISICYVAITVVQMIAIVALARFGQDLNSIIISMILLQFVFSAGLFAWIVKDIGMPLPNFKGLKTFLLFSVPQMPVIILLWIISLSDRYFITHFLGLSQNGIYSSSNTLVGLTSLFYAPISFALFPLVSRLWTQKRLTDVKSYSEYSVKLFLTLAIPGVIGISILSQPLLRLLTTSEFLVGEELVLVLATGAIFLGMYQINTNLLLLGKHSNSLPIMTAIAAGTSIVMNILLIPRIGIMGAALSNCASYFILVVFATLWARKTVPYDFNLKYLAKVLISTLAVAVCLYFLRVNSVLGIILAIVLGSIVFAIGLYLLKAFSEEDKLLIKKTINNLIPGYIKNRR